MVQMGKAEVSQSAEAEAKRSICDNVVIAREFCVDITENHHQYLKGYCIDGRILFPATGYLFLTWQVFSSIHQQKIDTNGVNLVPVEFYDVCLLRTLVCTDKPVQVHVEIDKSTGRFEIKEGDSLIVEGYVRAPTDPGSSLIYEHIKNQIKSENLSLVLNNDDIYKQFRINGYDYGHGYQNIQHASSDGRYSRVKSCRHLVALMDSMIQSILLSSSQYKQTKVMFLPTRFDYIAIQPDKIVEKLDKAQLSMDSSGCIKEKTDMRHTGSQPELLFDTYYDSISRTIISDGVEIRGIIVSPERHRSDDSKSVVIETFQFVADFENLTNDELLATANIESLEYTQVCDAVALELSRRLGCNVTAPNKSVIQSIDIERYKTTHTLLASNERKLKKNNDRILLSLLDQILNKASHLGDVKKFIQENRHHLSQDLLNKSFSQERVCRPLFGQIIENCAGYKNKLKFLGINLRDSYLNQELANFLEAIIKSIDSNISIDCTLAHSDSEQMKSGNPISTSSGSITRTHISENLESLCKNSQLHRSDIIVYPDVSCDCLLEPLDKLDSHSETRQLFESGLPQVGCYIVVLVREHMTFAERTLMALIHSSDLGESDSNKLGNHVDKYITQVRELLSARCDRIIDKAKSAKLLHVAKKSDANGHTLLLFRKVQSDDGTLRLPLVSKSIVLRVTHDKLTSIKNWLNPLRDHFRDDHELSKEDEEECAQKVVWLCAVATKQHQISGLLGFMRCILKEGSISSRLRCYYDDSTFKDHEEPITENDIEKCARFQEAVVRDQIWTCIDASGQVGSFHHFTIMDKLDRSNYLCKHHWNNELAPLVSGAYVNTAIRGDLSSFTWYEAPFKYLSEIEKDALVRVAYSALNLRDIMLATGRFPLSLLPPQLALNDCLLGIEFSGIDSSGKRVMGMVSSGGVATHIVCPEKKAIKIEVPDEMSLRNAATIPAVYSTAIMALIYRGQIQRGESILIHDGSSGVGQASIRLATHVGLKIYTTVDTNEKRKFLLDEFPDVLDSSDIFSWFDCDFERQVQLATKGRGVDLVLNSLSRDKLQASINSLSKGGRLLEIGKYDLSLNSRFEELTVDTNKTVHNISPDTIFDLTTTTTFHHQFKSIMSSLKKGVAEGYVKPIKSVVYKCNQVEEAFRSLSHDEYIGKVLIEIDASIEESRNKCETTSCSPSSGVNINCVPKFQAPPHKSFIITGGLGACGLELAKWLASHGARHLVITSRTGVSNAYQKVMLHELEQDYGVKILVLAATIADATIRDGAEKLCELAAQLAPSGQIGGIFHLATLFNEVYLDNLKAEEFVKMRKAKLDTCVHLDLITRQLSYKLEWFVAFSSVASAKGAAGFSAYGYANSCVERICERRRQDGHHGVAIQWGIIGDAGVGYNMVGSNDVYVSGTKPQRIVSCWDTLSKILFTPFPVCSSIALVDKSILATKFDLIESVLHILSVRDRSKRTDSTRLVDLGLNSLAATEICHLIEREFGRMLSPNDIELLTIGNLQSIQNGVEFVQAIATAAGGHSDLHNSNYQPSVSDVELENITEVDSALNTDPTQEVDANILAAIVPGLVLAREKFCRLNYLKWEPNEARVESSIDNKLSNKRPIFFIPATNGQFDGLEKLCSKMERPCIGLNWTPRVGLVKTITETAKIFIEVLQDINWRQNFYLGGLKAKDKQEVEDDAERVVDLVGYLNGATAAFEVMALVRKLQLRGAKKVAKGEADDVSHGLRAGRLILLDSTPRQVERISQYIFKEIGQQSAKLSDRLDDALILYIRCHTRDVDVDLVELKQELMREGSSEKIALAAYRLLNILNANLGNKNDGSASNPLPDDADEEKKFDKAKTQTEISMKAFCRWMGALEEYRVTGRAFLDCTLIRARESFVEQTVSEQMDYHDLGLSTMINGKIDVHIVEGDQEGLLNENVDQVREIIVKTLE